MEKRYQEAIKWLGMAADKGNAEAQYKLGKILVEEGFALIEQSAEQGYAEAKEWLSDDSEDDNNIDVENERNIKIGDIIKFGRYPQNNGDALESIEWRVLKIENDRALVISKYALDGGKPYNNEFESITWESCTLRKWLNNDFINKAFSKDEQQRIILVNVPAHSNPEYDTNQGNDTKDKIFLLSIKEANELFKDDIDRVCCTTKYTKKQGSDLAGIGRVRWLLRSLGAGSLVAADVGFGGGIFTLGNDVSSNKLAIRPAFYLNRNS